MFSRELKKGSAELLVLSQLEDRARHDYEIGIGMALGAPKASDLRMVIGKTAALAITGIVIGIGGDLALSRYPQSLLYQVRADDPSTFVLAAERLLVAALRAGLFPALRATGVDPIPTLRNE